MINLDKYIISDQANILDALAKIDKQSSDATLTLFVSNSNGKILGTVTDGDCRRGILQGLDLSDNVTQIMNQNFTSLKEGIFDLDLHQLIKIKGLKLIPVLNHEGKIIKLLNFKDKHAYLPLDAVLMAGGKGERLRPLTLTTPKPLLKIGEKSIIDYNIENLLNNGIENINVTVNYLEEQLEEHFANPIAGVQIKCIKEPQFLGTMGSIKYIDTWHNDSILVMNSDLFTNIDFEEFFIHFKENDADMSVAAVPYSVDIPYGILEIETTRDIVGIKEKPSFHYYANAGIYLIKKSVLELIPKASFYNATDLMEKLISDKKRVIRFPLSGYWIDIGKPEDFKKAQDFAKHVKNR